jgi:hypothetical protein
MKRVAKHSAWTFICAVVWVLPLGAQTYESSPFRRLNSNAAFTVSVPLSPTSNYTGCVRRGLQLQQEAFGSG